MKGHLFLPTKDRMERFRPFLPKHGVKPRGVDKRVAKRKRRRKHKLFMLKKAQMKRLRPFFPKPRGKARSDDLMVFGGIIHVIHRGLPWNHAPEEYGPWTTPCNRWKRWSDNGTFLLILPVLGARGKQNHTLFMDAAHLKTNRPASCLRLGNGRTRRLVGRTKGGLNSRLHVVADAPGRPILMIPTAVQVSDFKGARTLLERLPTGARVVVADRGHDADRIRKALEDKEIEHCIPSRRNRKDPIPHDTDIHKRRHAIENSFARLKDWRRVATRYDRCPKVYLSACALAAVVSFWL